MNRVGEIDSWLRNHWRVAVPKDWLEACLEWILSENEIQMSSPQSGQLNSPNVKELVFEQWLICDLREIGSCGLPTNITHQEKIILPGPYSLQVMHMIDVSTPYYGQLQKMKGPENENVNVTAATQQSQRQWEAKPNRMLMLKMTDGEQDIQGMEYQHIPSLSFPYSPGFKVCIEGPVLCRRGVLMLKAENVSVLGGEVEALVEETTEKKTVSDKLAQNQQLISNPPENPSKVFDTSKNNDKRQKLCGKANSERKDHINISQHYANNNTSSNRWTPPERSNINSARSNGSSFAVDNIEMEIPDDDILEAMNADQLNGIDEWGDDVDYQAAMNCFEESDSAAATKPIARNAHSSRLGTAPPMARIQTDIADRTREPFAIDNGVLDDIDFDESIDFHANNITSKIPTGGHLQQTSQMRGQIKATKGRVDQSASFHGRGELARRESQNKLLATPSLPNQEHYRECEEPREKKIKLESASNIRTLGIHDPPFTYLRLAQDIMAKGEEEILVVRIKGYIGTLMAKLEFNNGSHWSLIAKINDGTAAVDVDLGDKFLESLIGYSAKEAQDMRVRIRQEPHLKETLMNAITGCQRSLIQLSVILEIEFSQHRPRPYVRKQIHFSEIDIKKLVSRS